MIMLRNKMLAVISEVNDEVAERYELISCIAIALLTLMNVFILGDTGQAKSYVINRFRKRISGAKQFERLLSKQTDEEALFGRIDLKSYLDGSPKMITKGKIPESHIIFLDETWKCNEGVLNSLLTAMNERRYTNESETMDIPAISFMGASNEIPNFNNPDEQILRALFDRFHLKVVTNYIGSRDARLSMLLSKQHQTEGQINAVIELDELYAMQAEVAAINVPEQINELMDDILCELRRLGIHVSDRKYLNYYPIAQAHAWLEGRDNVQSSDLKVLKYYLWTTPEEIEVIQQVIERLCIPVQERLKEITLMAADSYEAFTGDADVKSTQAFKKLHGELIRLFRLLQQLESEATDTNSKAVINKVISDFEEMSKKAHEKCGFAYSPLFGRTKLPGGKK